MDCFLMSTAHGPVFLERMNYMYTNARHFKAVKGVKFGSNEPLQRNEKIISK